jgi:hypothetical protein
MSLLQTLLHPDREELEMADRMIVVSAANLLEVGEFQFLQLAHREWFGEDLPPSLVDRLFRSYMLYDEVPHWARHYARLILLRDERGVLNPVDLRYHRFDHEYRTQVRKGVRGFLAAVGALAFCLIASILVAQYSVRTPMTRLPPYFDREELQQPPGEPAGDADADRGEVRR